MTTTTLNEVEADRRTTRLLAAYATLVLLLVLVSARLWWQSPMHLIEHEFDYFLGLFASPDPVLSETWVALGRRLHLFALALIGGLYLVLVKRVADSPSLNTRRVVAWSAIVSVFFAIGMPWVSPDVFFYIGKGWAEVHYGVNPYLAGVNSTSGFGHDQMFANIYPGFVGDTTSYGPLFHKLAAALAALSGGDEKLALALHKMAALGLHAGCSWLVWRLAPANLRRVALFAYAANPLICFSVLTCAHNDHWMNLFVLLALLCVSRRRWWLAGAALGASFGMKYFPLVYVPVFGLAALLQQRESGGRMRNVIDAAGFTAGFVGVVGLSYLLYANSFGAFASVAARGVTAYRNCVYYFIDVFTVYALPNLFHVPESLVLYQSKVGDLLRGAYAVLYVMVLLIWAGRLRRDTFRGLVEACLLVTVLYFVLVNSSNQEWYLTWWMGLALILPHKRAQALALGLSAWFLPLVIFTVKNPAPIWFIANVALYCLVAALSIRYLVSTVRAVRTPEWRLDGGSDRVAIA